MLANSSTIPPLTLRTPFKSPTPTQPACPAHPMCKHLTSLHLLVQAIAYFSHISSYQYKDVKGYATYTHTNPIPHMANNLDVEHLSQIVFDHYSSPHLDYPRARSTSVEGSYRMPYISQDTTIIPPVVLPSFDTHPHLGRIAAQESPHCHHGVEGLQTPDAWRRDAWQTNAIIHATRRVSGGSPFTNYPPAASDAYPLGFDTLHPSANLGPVDNQVLDHPSVTANYSVGGYIMQQSHQPQAQYSFVGRQIRGYGPVGAVASQQFAVASHQDSAMPHGTQDQPHMTQSTIVQGNQDAMLALPFASAPLVGEPPVLPSQTSEEAIHTTNRAHRLRERKAARPAPYTLTGVNSIAGPSGPRTRKQRSPRGKAAIADDSQGKKRCPFTAECEEELPLNQTSWTKHLRSHFSNWRELLDAKASVRCAVEGCGGYLQFSGLPRHVLNTHVGRAYKCPVPKCEDWCQGFQAGVERHVASKHPEIVMPDEKGLTVGWARKK